MGRIGLAGRASRAGRAGPARSSSTRSTRSRIDPTGLARSTPGASTGGFTDVLLARGARIVYAVDVGRAQLIQRLRDDPRVVSMERTNLRELRELPEPIDLATLDLSFISLRLVLPAVRALLADAGRVVAPREAAVRGRPRGCPARRRRDRPGDVWERVLREVASAAADAGLHPHRAIRSPITGGDGNVEFLVDLRARSDDADGIGARTVSRRQFDAP